MNLPTTILVTCLVIAGYLASPPFVGYVYLTIDSTASKYPGLLHGIAIFYAPSEALGQIYPPYRSYVETVARNLGLAVKP